MNPSSFEIFIQKDISERERNKIHMREFYKGKRVPRKKEGNYNTRFSEDNFYPLENPCGVSCFECPQHDCIVEK
jgi:hypothetical protein